MQNGSMMRTERHGGPDVWEFRWREPGPDGKRKHRRMVVGTTNEFGDEVAARQAIAGLHLCMNSRSERVIQKCGFPEADFWPASLRVHPGHNFRVARDPGIIAKVTWRTTLTGSRPTELFETIVGGAPRKLGFFKFELYTAILRLAQKESAFDRVIALIEVHAPGSLRCAGFLATGASPDAVCTDLSRILHCFRRRLRPGAVGRIRRTRLVRYLDTGHSPHLEHADGIDGG